MHKSQAHLTIQHTHTQSHATNPTGGPADECGDDDGLLRGDQALPVQPRRTPVRARVLWVGGWVGVCAVCTASSTLSTHTHGRTMYPLHQLSPQKTTLSLTHTSPAHSLSLSLAHTHTHIPLPPSLQLSPPHTQADDVPLHQGGGGDVQPRRRHHRHLLPHQGEFGIYV
jgi:hypothetical protein